MKKIVSLLFLFLFCYTSYAELTTSEKIQALQLAKSICGEGEYDYYYSPTFVNYTYQQNTVSQSVMLFVDLEPTSSWEHDCKFIYVSRSFDVYEVIDSQLPPSDVVLLPLTQNHIIQSRNHQFNLPTNNLNSENVSNHTYAIIINGGLNMNSNQERYWQDCSFIYQTLHNSFNISKSHIKVISADGTDPAPDLITQDTKELINSPLDFDGDNTDDIEYAATKENLNTVFRELSETITDEDHLFVFVTGNGHKPFFNNNNDEYALYLWNNETLTPNEFSEYLDMIDAQCISIVMGQNYSGTSVS